MDAILKKTSSEIQYPVLEQIKNRRSIRAFANQAIENEKINSLFEAVRWAPSSVNEQPWVYIYAAKNQDPELWKKLFNELNERNKLWAKDAPLLMLSLARTIFSRNNTVNTSAHHDLGLANAFLSLQAVQLGLQAHQIGGYNKETIRANLNIPQYLEPGPIIAIGYPGDPRTLPESLREREFSPRIRFLQDEFIMNEVFTKNS